jgi:uncharacterized protein YdbL (DUF1318 family)
MVAADLVQTAYTATLTHLIAHGRAPHYTDLAETLQVSVEESRLAQVAAAEKAVGCWMSSGTDYVGSWAPFANTPTQYLISVDGIQKWYGQ